MGGKAIEKIIRQFQIGEGNFSYQPFGSGHINDTYIVRPEEASREKYLLQRINHQVFKDVESLMHNMRLVTMHLKNKLSVAKDNHFTTVEIIPTHQGELYYQDESGFWRMQTFISGSITFDVATSERQAFEAGFAFGKFQVLLQDMPVDVLKETIPDFHNIAYRFRHFDAALKEDAVGRKGSVREEIQFAMDRKKAMLTVYARVINKEVPVRITHNDTKFNNVLLDQRTQKARCVIDLDTVMPGVVWYDFGDAVRTIVNRAAEDEKDADKIDVNMAYFKAFTGGFLQETATLLTDTEVAALAFSAQYMTFIMGLRFLTDYMAGDVYYKTGHPHHNLQRARAQFTLLTKMEERAGQMQEFVLQTYRNFCQL